MEPMRVSGMAWTKTEEVGWEEKEGRRTGFQPSFIDPITGMS